MADSRFFLFLTTLLLHVNVEEYNRGGPWEDPGRSGGGLGEDPGRSGGGPGEDPGRRITSVQKGAE